MKTSFYLVIWIIICICLLLCNTNEFVRENIAIISTIIVLGLLWVINTRLSSQLYLLHERKLLRVRSLSYNIDNISKTNERVPNLSSFIRYGRVIFFVISLIFIGYNLVYYRVLDYWWGLTDWFGFIIFTIFSLQIIFKTPFRRDDISESNIINETHVIEYKKHVISSIPKCFLFYKKLNIFFSILATLLGILIGVCAIYLFVIHKETRLVTPTIGLACAFYIYGTLATYFGIKDFLSILLQHNNKQ